MLATFSDVYIYIYIFYFCLCSHLNLEFYVNYYHRSHFIIAIKLNNCQFLNNGFQKYWKTVSFEEERNIMRGNIKN